MEFPLHSPLTHALQGSMLTPMLYSLYTPDSVAKHISNAVYKIAEDTTVVG